MFFERFILLMGVVLCIGTASANPVIFLDQNFGLGLEYEHKSSSVFGSMSVNGVYNLYDGFPSEFETNLKMACGFKYRVLDRGNYSVVLGASVDRRGRYRGNSQRSGVYIYPFFEYSIFPGLEYRLTESARIHVFEYFSILPTKSVDGGVIYGPYFYAKFSPQIGVSYVF